MGDQLKEKLYIDQNLLEFRYELIINSWLGNRPAAENINNFC